jgi:hypothetical protein
MIGDNVNEVLVVSRMYDPTNASNVFDTLNAEYPVVNPLWEWTKDSLTFTYPQHIVCSDDPKNSRLDPWGRQIRRWKYYEDDSPLVWQDRVQTHPHRGPMFPSNCPSDVSYYAWTSIHGTCIALYLVHGKSNTFSTFT